MSLTPIRQDRRCNLKKGAVFYYIGDGPGWVGYVDDVDPQMPHNIKVHYCSDPSNDDSQRFVQVLWEPEYDNKPEWGEVCP